MSSRIVATFENCARVISKQKLGLGPSNESMELFDGAGDEGKIVGAMGVGAGRVVRALFEEPPCGAFGTFPIAADERHQIEQRESAHIEQWIEGNSLAKERVIALGMRDERTHSADLHIE